MGYGGNMERLMGNKRTQKNEGHEGEGVMVTDLKCNICRLVYISRSMSRRKKK